MRSRWQLSRPHRIWSMHPAVRQPEQLTMGERAADHLRNGMGSWAFVASSLVFLAGWMIGNGTTGFDPYPFILLNLVLSCVAALQGAVLLIAGRRSDQISAELAVHDYNTDAESARIIKEIREITGDIQTRMSDPQT